MRILGPSILIRHRDFDCVFVFRIDHELDIVAWFYGEGSGIEEQRFSRIEVPEGVIGCGSVAQYVPDYAGSDVGFAGTIFCVVIFCVVDADPCAAGVG